MPAKERVLPRIRARSQAQNFIARKVRTLDVRLPGLWVPMVEVRKDTADDCC